MPRRSAISGVQPALSTSCRLAKPAMVMRVSASAPITSTAGQRPARISSVASTSAAAAEAQATEWVLCGPPQRISRATAWVVRCACCRR